jgi:hypothetical protein
MRSVRAGEQTGNRYEQEGDPDNPEDDAEHCLISGSHLRAVFFVESTCNASLWIEEKRQ